MTPKDKSLGSKALWRAEHGPYFEMNTMIIVIVENDFVVECPEIGPPSGWLISALAEEYFCGERKCSVR